jgi:DNA-binding Lrp family transcriptional regulator
MGKRRDVNQLIRKYLAEHPGTKREKAARALDIPAATLGSHVKNLIELGEVQDGLTLTTHYRKQLFKSFIFINTTYRGKALDDLTELDYQQQLVQAIERKISKPPYNGLLFLESVEIVMGADFDIILILYAPDISPIGMFVTKYLRPHRYVKKTQTITVWPSQSVPVDEHGEDLSPKLADESDDSPSITLEDAEDE